MPQPHASHTTEPARAFDLEERSAMALLRLVASVGLAVVVLGVALRLGA